LKEKEKRFYFLYRKMKKTFEEKLKEWRSYHGRKENKEYKNSKTKTKTDIKEEKEKVQAKHWEKYLCK